MFTTQGSDDGTITAAIFWEGVGGALVAAVIGGLVSALVALWVVRLTQKGDEAKALRSDSRAAAGQLTVGVIELMHAAGLIARMESRDQRLNHRREMSTEAATLFNLHQPALQLPLLRADAQRAHAVIVDFLTHSERADDTVVRFPRIPGIGMPSGASTVPRDPWHRPAHRELGRYLSGFTKRLAQHRLGESVPSDPLPPPEWPPLSREGPNGG
ncbi:hypothetical protein GCM10027053_03810 [Intrasporangium mesophilum]